MACLPPNNGEIKVEDYVTFTKAESASMFTACLKACDLPLRRPEIGPEATRLKALRYDARVEQLRLRTSAPLDVIAVVAKIQHALSVLEEVMRFQFGEQATPEININDLAASCGVNRTIAKSALIVSGYRERDREPGQWYYSIGARAITVPRDFLDWAERNAHVADQKKRASALH